MYKVFITAVAFIMTAVIVINYPAVLNFVIILLGLIDLAKGKEKEVAAGVCFMLLLILWVGVWPPLIYRSINK